MVHLNKSLLIILFLVITLTNYAQSLTNLGFGNDNTFDVITWNTGNLS